MPLERLLIFPNSFLYGHHGGVEHIARISLTTGVVDWTRCLWFRTRKIGEKTNVPSEDNVQVKSSHNFATAKWKFQSQELLCWSHLRTISVACCGSTFFLTPLLQKEQPESSESDLKESVSATAKDAEEIERRQGQVEQLTEKVENSEREQKQLFLIVFQVSSCPATRSWLESNSGDVMPSSSKWDKALEGDVKSA